MESLHVISAIITPDFYVGWSVDGVDAIVDLFHILNRRGLATVCRVSEFPTDGGPVLVDGHEGYRLEEDGNMAKLSAKFQY